MPELKKTRKITVNVAIDELDLSHIQKKDLSEILRLTNLGKGLFKTMENFAGELSCEVGYLHNTLYFLNKQGLIERRKGKQDRRLFVYFATQKTLDFVNNFVNDLSTKNEQRINDLSTTCERLVKNIPAPSSVEATNKVFNILRIECIKDLNNEMVKPLSPRPTATLSKIEILKQEIQANPLYPKIISLYPKIPSERLETEIEFALTKYIEIGRTSGAFAYVKSYLSNSDFKDVLTNKKLEIEDEINARRKTAYDNKTSSNSGTTGFNSVSKTEIIEVDPIQFETRELFEQKIDELKTQNKEFKRREITPTIERVWSENESELVQNKPKSRFEITETESQKTDLEIRTPMQIMMDAIKKSNPKLAEQMGRGVKNPFTNIAQKLAQSN